VLYVQSLGDIKVLNHAGASPWSLPATPMDKVLAVYNMRDLTPRVRVEGTITYYQPGSAIVLQAGSKSLWIATHTREPLQVGDEADATGFPDTHNNHLALMHAEIQDSRTRAPVSPQLATWHQLALWSRSKTGGHENDLVSIEGRVVTEVREATQDEYVLISDGQLFTAFYRHPLPPNPVPEMLQVPLGSTIRVTGICLITDSAPFNGEVPFDILMRSFDDIRVVATPSLLNIRNLGLIIGLLLAIVAGVGARSWALERQVRQQTAALAARIKSEMDLERRRSSILEDINGARPLAEILENITGIVSYLLKGARCWCEIAGGARLGDQPSSTENLRIASTEIPARNGPPLGTIFAGLDPLTVPTVEESDALSAGVRLAALAIENRRLYNDLLYRSEFDQLTDIHNRFSMDRHLESLIMEAREKASIFGLVYIDLDEFKKVNDLYGHQIGDMYLQEVALRMKKQLRSHDMLARLGGDEFAVLVPVVHSHTEVQEIALRLEQSFDEPYALQGIIIQGSASIGIAVYPEDGTTKDDLLCTADAAMYTAKSIKQQDWSANAPSAEELL